MSLAAAHLGSRTDFLLVTKGEEEQWAHFTQEVTKSHPLGQVAQVQMFPLQGDARGFMGCSSYQKLIREVLGHWSSADWRSVT